MLHETAREWKDGTPLRGGGGIHAIVAGFRKDVLTHQFNRGCFTPPSVTQATVSLRKAEYKNFIMTTRKTVDIQQQLYPN
jgi:hypothetical protein